MLAKMSLKTAISAMALAGFAAIPAQAGIFGSMFSATDEQAVYNGQDGALAVSLAPEKLPCGPAKLSLRHIETGKLEKFSRLNGTDTPGQVIMKRVAPGTYQIEKASCHLGNTVYRFDDIATAYGRVVVRPGEVVYPGTMVPVRAGRSVVAYDLVDHGMASAQTVARKAPNLLGRFVNRPVSAPKSRAALVAARGRVARPALAAQGRLSTR